MTEEQEKFLREYFGIDDEEFTEEDAIERMEELVHDAKSAEAAEINNGGLDDQMDYVFGDEEQRSDVSREDDNNAAVVVHFDGLEVYVYRSLTDHMLVVEIDSAGIDSADVREDEDGVPKLRVYCNDARIMDNGDSIPESEQNR